MTMTMFVVAASAAARERVRHLLAGAGVRVVGEGSSLAEAAAAGDVDVIVVADLDLLESWRAGDTERQPALVVLSGDLATATIRPRAGPLRLGGPAAGRHRGTDDGPPACWRLPVS